MSEPTARKPHRDWAGYVCELRNKYSGGHTVVVRAEEAGLDPNGGKYAVICDKHNTLINTTILQKARSIMRDPTIFCEDCRKALAEVKP